MKNFIKTLRKFLGLPAKTIDDALVHFNKALAELREREKEHLQEAEEHAKDIAAAMIAEAIATEKAVRASGLTKKFSDLLA